MSGGIFGKISSLIRAIFGGKAMPNPKNVDVDVVVIPDPTRPEGVRFELGCGVLRGEKLVFRNDQHPGFVVDFNIVDPTGTGCLFLPVPNDAIWVAGPTNGNQPPCPMAPSNWAEFSPTNVIAGNTRLRVRNLNQNDEKFTFTLRFSKPGYPNPIEYDPIGNNQNGPQM